MAMTTLHFSAYARHRKCSPGYITKLRHEGRLVLTDGGLVDVEASDSLIEQTTANRLDVAARHAQKRAEDKKQPSEGAGIGSKEKIAPRSTAPDEGGEKLVDAKTRKESAQADQEEMKAAQMAGNLISREDVEAAMRFIGAAVRSALEVFPDQISPLVAPISDLAEINEVLTQACRDALHGIGDAIKRQEAELNKETA